jgi:hypothetical protein
MKELVDGKINLYEYARANYRDYVSGNQHRTDFCSQTLAWADKPRGKSFAQQACPEGHNCTDDDCHFFGEKAPPAPPAPPPR